MSIIPFPRTVHIVEADPVWAQSIKFMLETHQRLVKTYDKSTDFSSRSCRADDVVLMREHKVNSFLVGEAFMRADEPGRRMAELFFE